MKFINLISKSTSLVGLLLSVSIVCTAKGHDNVPAPQQSTPILLTNAVVHTVSGLTFEKGSILFEKGVIVAIGDAIKAPANCELIDLQGKHIYPGLISSISELGLVEIQAVRATVDLRETGSLNPNALAATAINPDSELIAVTRANGVLTANVFPGEGLISGTASAINLEGWTIDEMTVKEKVGLVVRWPWPPHEPQFDVNREFVYEPERDEEDYEKKIKKMNDLFDDVRAFEKAMKGSARPIPVDLKQEALLPALTGEVPVFVFASSIRQIRDAVSWARKQKVRLVIVGGADAGLASELLKANDVGVILDSVNLLPSRRWEPYDARYELPELLRAAGVRFSIGVNGDAGRERNLAYEAGKAVAFGLSPEEALKAVTLYPAQILGLEDRLGSLEIGKDATLIITDGDPLEIRTTILQVYVKGRPVDLSSRHSQLYEKYQKKYEQLEVK